MNRTEAATTLLQWQLDGERDLVRATDRDGGRTLVSIVEAVARGRKRRPVPVPVPPPPPADFLQLDEEEAVEALRARLRALAPVLRPEERQRLEARLRDLMPEGEIVGVQAELDRLGGRLLRQTLSRDLEDTIAPPPLGAPVPFLRAVLLFARDGRLLASEGEPSSLDLTAFSALVARGEPGSTWSRNQGEGVAVGHVGQRAGLVAVFAGRPTPAVGGTLRVSLASLEQKDRLANVLTHPSSHQALTAYVRAVRALLTRNA